MIADRTTTPHDPCLELDQLAALAEGRLIGEERQAALAHVADCPSCHELFVEIRRSLDELAAEGAGEPAGPPTKRPSGPPVDATPGQSPKQPTDQPGAGLGTLATAPATGSARLQPKRSGGTPTETRHLPARAPARPASWRLFAVAATLAALVASGVFLYNQPDSSARAPSRAALVALLPPATQAAPLIWGGVVERGAPAERPPARDSAELGALLLDLDLALAAGDSARAAGVARRAAAIVDAAGLLDDEARRLRAVVEDPSTLFPESARRSELVALDARLRQRFLPFYLDLGAFAEAARLATASSTPSLLADGDARGYLRWLVEQQEEPLSQPQREAIATLAGDRRRDQQAAAAVTLLESLTR